MLYSVEIRLGEVYRLLPLLSHRHACDSHIYLGAYGRDQRIKLHVLYLYLHPQLVTHSVDQSYIEAVRLSVVTYILERREFCIGTDSEHSVGYGFRLA